jgi:hypothetical protein
MIPTALGVAAAPLRPWSALNMSNETSSGANGAMRHDKETHASPSWKDQSTATYICQSSPK